MAKSLRTAFIRVSSENNTKEGIIQYTTKDIENLLSSWSKSCKLEYFYIEHFSDEEVSMTHWHIVIKFKSPMPFEAIKTKFPYGDIESAKNLKACVQYLIHANDESKVQYKWDDIKTNCKDMSPYKIATNTQQEITIQKILENIDMGVIRDYNQFEHIPIHIWSKYKSRIENALIYYRERLYMDKNRNVKVVFFSGDTGTGKTTFAKKYCEKNKKSYCISSCSNDPMQDYKGEDVLILDDLRDSDFKFTDLLKILDNHTKSSMRARYSNKCFIGDMIIITSYKPLNDWYFDISSENKHQLYRRIGEMYKFDNEKIYVFSYSEQKCRYQLQGTLPNVITEQIKKEKNNVALNMAETFGVEFTPVNNIDKININEITQTINDNECPFK